MLNDIFQISTEDSIIQVIILIMSQSDMELVQISNYITE